MEEPLDTIETIAAHYISEIRAVDPEGPYALAGFSLGGKIAFEMARQLKAMGKEVSFIGLLDATADESFEHLPRIKRFRKKTVHYFRYAAWNLTSIFRERDESTISLLKRKWQGLERKITGMDIKMKNIDGVSKGRSGELPKYMRKVHSANRLAEKRYIIHTYDGPVHLFKARKQTFYIADPVTYGWDKAALGGVIVHDIPGEHSSIFAPPNDKYFATVMQRHLNTTQH